MITLIRYLELPSCTFGILIADSEIYTTLELPWRSNERNRSRIPAGEYQCSYMSRSSSGKYRGVYHVQGVQERSGILIHNGNLPEQTKGCILIGKRRGTLAGKPAVLNSVSALRNLASVMNKENFKLRVISWIG